MNITSNNQTGGVTAMSVNQTMSNSPGAVQSASTSSSFRPSQVWECIQMVQANENGETATNIRVTHDGETKEMSYAEFFTRLGFKHETES